MKLKRIGKDLILKCRWFSAEFMHNCHIGRPNYGQFSTGKHKYFHFGKHVLAIHLR